MILSTSDQICTIMVSGVRFQDDCIVRPRPRGKGALSDFEDEHEHDDEGDCRASLCVDLIVKNSLICIRRAQRPALLKFSLKPDT